MYTLKERLWLTEDRSRVVKDGDPEAFSLLGGEGQEIPEEDAIKYGLMKEGEGAETAEAKSVESAAENKAVGAPPENKSRAATKASKKSAKKR